MDNIIQETNYQDKFTLIDAFLIFIQNKKKIFLITGIFCIGSIIVYFFILDLIYTSSASIKSTNANSNILGNLDIGIPNLSDIENLGFGNLGSAKELASYEQILLSRRCIEPLIVKFGLMDRDGSRFMDDAIKNFRDNKLKIDQDKIAGVLHIIVEDSSPELAKDMVEFLIQQLDKINIELNITNAKNNREFIEKRYLQAKEDLRNSEDTLKSYQMVYGIAPDLQVKASAQSLFTLEAEVKAEEVKLDVIRKVLSSDQPEVKIQEEKVISLKNKVAEIQSSTNLEDILRLGNSPQIVMNYLRLQRDIEIHTKILSFILPIYERAKIDEKKFSPTVIILDNPTIAERKTKPKRLTMVLAWTFIGFVLSTLFYITLYKWNIFKKTNDYKRLFVMKK